MGNPQLSLQSAPGTSMLRAESAGYCVALAESPGVSVFVMAVFAPRERQDDGIFPWQRHVPGMVLLLQR